MSESRQPPDDPPSEEPRDHRRPPAPLAPPDHREPAMPPPPSWAGPMTAPPPPGWAGPSRAPSRGADRLLVHIVWEVILAVIALVLIAVVLVTGAEGDLASVFGRASLLGLVAAALALSLRTGTPNLAVGAAAGLAGILTAYLSNLGSSLPVAVITAVVVVFITGLMTGGLVAALSVPAWAATLGAAGVIDAIGLLLTDNRIISASIDTEYPTALWFGLFLVVSIGGGALWLLPGVRDRLSAPRRPADPARWAGPAFAVAAVAGIAGSTFVASLGGLANLMYLRAAEPFGGENLTTGALAAVLLGGTSLFGRRGGVTGTVLGVMIVALAQNVLAIHFGSRGLLTLFTAALILVGLGVTRGIESVSGALEAPRARPAPPPPPP